MNYFSRLQELGANLPDRVKTRRASACIRCQTASEAAGGWEGALHCFEALCCHSLQSLATTMWYREKQRSRQDERFKLSELFLKEHGSIRVLQLVRWSCVVVSSAWAFLAKPCRNITRTWTTTCHPWVSGENTPVFPRELWLLCLAVFPLKLAFLPPIHASDSRVGSWSLTKLIN